MATGRDELLERLASVTREIVTGLPDQRMLVGALAVGATVQLVTDFDPLAVMIGAVAPGAPRAQAFQYVLPPEIAGRYAEAAGQFIASGLNAMPVQDQSARVRLVTDLSRDGAVFSVGMERGGRYVVLFGAKLRPDSETGTEA